MVSATHFVYCDPKLPVVVAADASFHGIGAMISHRMRDPNGKSNGSCFDDSFASGAQLQADPEGSFGSCFCIGKFHQYLYGQEFILLTDHKPSVTIFGSEKGTPVVTAQRLQRWAPALRGCTFQI